MQILTDDDEWNGGLLLGPPVEFKFLDTGADDGAVEAYGATFNNVDRGGDTIAPGAFAQTLQEHRTAGTSPAFLWAHKNAEPVGKWNAMGEDARGLRMRGQLNLDTPAGRKAHAHLKAGDVSTFSIGYLPRPGGAARGPNGTRMLSAVDLHEVSISPVAMDQNAKLISVKSIANIRDLEDALRGSGFSKSDARKITAGGWPVFSGEPQDDPHLAALGRALDASLIDLKNLKGFSR